MPLTEDAIREALKQVVDPELFVNIIDLGLVYSVVVEPAGEKENVKIEMTMTSPACPAGPQLIGQSKQVVGALPNVGDVEVKLVMTPPWSPDLMTEAARDQLGIF
jgi:metal-sulfur cluster biosynthetic enzyme